MADEMEAQTAAARVIDALYRAVESCDDEQLRRIPRPDAFVLTPTASGVLTSADLVIADIQHWSDVVAAWGATIRLRTESRLAGASASGQAAWVFDHVVAEAIQNGAVLCSVPIRLTALLARDEDWRVAAAYWSVPFETQEEQDLVKHAGELEPGKTLDERIEPGAEPLVDALQGALAQPQLLPALYSTRDDHVTIGSVVEEVFVGDAGQAAWQEFVQYVTESVPRGPMCGALVAPDVGWLAANIDIGDPPTPYRFFYVWIREETGWRIVVSHDAVSRSPLDTDTSVPGSA